MEMAWSLASRRDSTRWGRGAGLKSPRHRSAQAGVLEVRSYLGLQTTQESKHLSQSTRSQGHDFGYFGGPGHVTSYMHTDRFTAP